LREEQETKKKTKEKERYKGNKDQYKSKYIINLYGWIYVLIITKDGFLFGFFWLVIIVKEYGER
jgi:hypothetical protein